MTPSVSDRALAATPVAVPAAGSGAGGAAPLDRSGAGRLAVDADADAVAPPVRALIELFASALREVRFPDADGEVLATAAAEVRRAAAVVAEAARALEAASEGLAQRQEALLQRAQRALAYARVYAEDDPALLARVEAIALPRPARRASPSTPSVTEGAAAAAPRRRGRPRRDAAASLFALGPATGEGGAAA